MGRYLPWRYWCGLDYVITYRGDTGVVGQHQATDAVSRLDVRGLTGQRHLDAGGAPGDELGQLPLPDPLQTLVNLTEKQAIFSLQKLISLYLLVEYQSSRHSAFLLFI